MNRTKSKFIQNALKLFCFDCRGDDNLTQKLTSDDIHSILSKKLGTTPYKLVNYEIEKPGDALGLLGDHFILKTIVNVTPAENTNTPDETFTFFAKFIPSNEEQLVYCLRMGSFHREGTLYELFDKMRDCGITYIDCVPKTYYQKENFVIVMEYLKIDGFDVMNKKTLLSYDSVLLVLQTLAKLHASSIIYEEKETARLGRTYRLSEDYEEIFEEVVYGEKGREEVESSIKGLLSEIDLFEYPETLGSGKKFRDVARDVCFKALELLKASNRTRNVLCHGDLWSTNFLLKCEREKPCACKLVDFQQSRYLPPAVDVLCLLYLTTSREFREQHMYELIGIYYTILEKLLARYNVDVKSIVSLGDFLESCETYKAFAIFQCATHLQFIMIDDGRLKELFEDLEYCKSFFTTDRTPLIAANFDDAYYRGRLQDSVADLKEYCERV